MATGYPHIEHWLRYYELAGGGRLTINKLLTVSPAWRQLRLAFLSSCESGIAGAPAVPDELLGIHTAFLQAGAQAAIGSLWPVYDDTAMVFADRFYRYYLDSDGREGVSPGAALSKAQHWLRSVTVKELLDDGLFTPQEMTELLHCRARQSRQLRGSKSGNPGTRLRGTNRLTQAGTDVLSMRRMQRPWNGPVL